MSVLVFAVDRPELPPFTMSHRFRHDITYFASPAGTEGVPDKLPPDEYWVLRDDAERIFDDGVITIVSPLDSASRTELEITEEQEDWLQWMNQHKIEHVRLEYTRTH